MNESSVQRRGLVVAALVVFVLSLVMPGADQRTDTVHLSSHVLGDAGGRGFYRVLEALDVEVSRWQRPLIELPERGATAVALLAPRLELADAEADRLVDVVASGGVVVYVPAEHDDEIDAFGARLGLSLRSWSGDVAPWTGAPPELRAILDDLPERLADHEAVVDVDENTVDAVDVLVADDTSAVAVARLSLGRGVVLVPSVDPSLLTTANLAAHEPTATAAVRLVLATLEGRPLAFDEYHHGYQDGAGVVTAFTDWAVSTHSGWAVSACAALALLWLVAAGWRFGRALATPPPAPRSSLEHVDALAAAFAAAKASARPAALLVEGLRRRWRLATIRDLDQRLDALSTHHPDLADDVATIRRALPSSDELWTRRDALATLCAAIDRVADTGPRGRAHPESS